MKEGRQLALIKSKKTTTLQTKTGKSMDVVQIVYDRLDTTPAKETTKNLPLYKLETNETLSSQLQALEVGSKVCFVVDNERYGEILEIKDAAAAPAEGSKSTTPRSGGRYGGGRDQNTQNSITFQNALAHATALVLHNSTGTVTANDILKEAYNFYDVSRDPEKARTTIAATAEAATTTTTAIAGTLEEVVQKAPTQKFDF